MPKRKPQGFAARIVNEDDDEDKPLVEEQPVPQDVDVTEDHGKAIGSDGLDLDQDEENPEGDQYDPLEGPEQLYWSELDQDDPLLDEEQGIAGYATQIVPLDEMLEEISPQAKAVTAAPSKENTLLSSQA